MDIVPANDIIAFYVLVFDPWWFTNLYGVTERFSCVKESKMIRRKVKCFYLKGFKLCTWKGNMLEWEKL